MNSHARSRTGELCDAWETRATRLALPLLLTNVCAHPVQYSVRQTRNARQPWLSPPRAVDELCFVHGLRVKYICILVSSSHDHNISVAQKTICKLAGKLGLGAPCRSPHAVRGPASSCYRRAPPQKLLYYAPEISFVYAQPGPVPVPAAQSAPFRPGRYSARPDTPMPSVLQRLRSAPGPAPCTAVFRKRRRLTQGRRAWGFHLQTFGSIKGGPVGPLQGRL